MFIRLATMRGTMGPILSRVVSYDRKFLYKIGQCTVKDSDFKNI